MKTTVRAALVTTCAAALAAASIGAWAGGGMLISNRDRSLAINAWGGASAGATLRLHNACRSTNDDCNWTYRGGLIYSDRDAKLVIKPAALRDGAPLVLAAGCRRELRECTWTYRDGMFVNDADPALAISAAGGARYGTTLRLSKDCRPSNPDCTWSR